MPRYSLYTETKKAQKECGKEGHEPVDESVPQKNGAFPLNPGLRRHITKKGKDHGLEESFPCHKCSAILFECEVEYED